MCNCTAAHSQHLLLGVQDKSRKWSQNQVNLMESITHICSKLCLLETIHFVSWHHCSCLHIGITCAGNRRIVVMLDNNNNKSEYFILLVFSRASKGRLCKSLVGHCTSDNRGLQMYLIRGQDSNTALQIHWRSTAQWRWWNVWCCTADIDECSTLTNPCDAHSKSCTNEDGSYTCICETGYVNKDNLCVGESCIAIWLIDWLTDWLTDLDLTWLDLTSFIDLLNEWTE